MFVTIHVIIIEFPKICQQPMYCLFTSKATFGTSLNMHPGPLNIFALKQQVWERNCRQSFASWFLCACPIQHPVIRWCLLLAVLCNGQLSWPLLRQLCLVSLVRYLLWNFFFWCLIGHLLSNPRDFTESLLFDSPHYLLQKIWILVSCVLSQFKEWQSFSWQFVCPSACFSYQCQLLFQSHQRSDLF